MMSSIRLSLFFALLAVLPAAVYGQSLSPSDEWINDLRLGGHVIVFRHGATTQAKSDPMSNPMGGKNDAERQLTDGGRAQAKAIGEAMHRLKIPVAMVMTSTLQRAIDTGTLLGLGEIQATTDLTESGPAISPEENKRRAQVLRQLVSLFPPADNNIVIVTHKPNIVAAFGEDWSDVHEGEASVFEPDGQGGFKLIVTVQADEWNELARAPH
jgi:broad specificity phosphatase PhoE